MRRVPTLEDALEMSEIDILHPGGMEITRRIAEVAEVSGRRVLDVACGRGSLPCYYAGSFGAHVTGVDLNPDMVRSSADRARREGVAHLTEFKVADSLALPFEDGAFDVVINECAVGLTSDPQRCLDEMARVVAPGGRVAIHESTWLKALPEPRRAEVVARLGTVPHTLPEWEGMMARAGLSDLRTEDWSGPEKLLLMRPGRKPRRPTDLLSLWETLSILLPRVISRYGPGGLIHLYGSMRALEPLYMDGTLGYSLIHGRKR